MGLLNVYSLKVAVSRLALGVVFGSATVGIVNVYSAGAAEIIYNGSDSIIHLKQDPTGNTAAAIVFNSLFVDGIYSGNTIKVGSNNATVVSNWNTQKDASESVAPYVIYGGVSIGNPSSSINGNGKEVFNNSVTMEGVAYNWAGDMNKAPDGIVGGSGIAGMGGGSVFGGLSVGGMYNDNISFGGGIGGDVHHNNVTLKNVTLTGSQGGANVNGNPSTMGGNGGNGGASIFGGASYGGTPYNNGGYSGGNGGKVSDNTVILIDVVLKGGKGGNGGNSFSGGTGVGGMGGGSVVGGISVGGASTFYNGNIPGGDGGEVSGNNVILQNVTLIGSQGGEGGSSIGNTNASSSNSTGVGGMGGGSVFGGLSIGGSTGYLTSYFTNGGDVIGNNVTLTDVVLNGAQGGSGGSLRSGDWGGSGVGGMGGGSVFGGLSIGGSGGIDGINTAKGGDVEGNIVALTNVTLNGAQGGKGGDVGFGGAGIGGMGGGSIFGGLSIGGSARSIASGDGGDVSNNTVILSSVTLSGAQGGSAGIGLGGSTGFNNPVNVPGVDGIAGLDGGNIFGGVSIGGALGTDTTAIIGKGGSTNNNTVTLIGDKITLNQVINGVTTYGSIWGGKSIDGAGVSFNESGADFATIFEKVISGNTLNLVGYRGSVSGIYNFENYNWTLPSDVKNGDTLITIAEGGSAVDLTGTKHNVADMKVSDNRLNGGDEVTFITKTTGTWSSSLYTIKQGQFIIYEASLAQKPNGNDEAFVLTINKKDDTTPQPIADSPSAAKVNPQSKSYSEGRAAALGFLNQANDLISMAGIDTIRIMVRANDDDVKRLAFIPFMIANGSSQRYNTGSHVDIKGFNMALGIATGFDFYVGHKATVGAFFEYGRGTYDTYNNFSNFSSVHGDGSTDYKGGGLFGRIDFANTGLGRVINLAVDQADGVYLEASIRAGRASSKFDVGNNIFGQMENGYHGSYDSNSRYYGGHLAGGYVFNFNEKQSLDVYSRYLWVHMDSDTVSISNEKLRFDRAQSSRLQIGGRYAYAYNEQFKPYIGAAYEYEFDGEIAARAYEFNLDKPSLQGSTGIFEAGFNFQPIATNQYFNINVNAQGYVGQRQGGGGGVKIKYQF